jgi:hypothetical protein
MDPLPGSTALPPRRALRAAPLLALAGLVLAGHAWLAQLLAPALPRPGLPQGGPVLLRSLPPVAALPPAGPDAAPAAPAAAPAPPPARTAVGRPPPLQAAITPPSAEAEPVPSPDAAAPADTAAAARSMPHPVVIDPLADAVAPPDAEGEPPPLYATRIPPPVALTYTLLRDDGRTRQTGTAGLAWQHDGRSYQLTLEALADDGRPLLVQASSGTLDAHGLVPERFVDRRAGGRQRAANFRHDTGRIGYSGPTHEHPAWPGAQDRLSWLAQLAAVLAAAGQPPDALRLFVADATGQAGLWQLQRLTDTAEPLPGAPAAQHWRRDPPRPEGLRIDVWLPPPGGAGPAGWPLRLRFTVPRSGHLLELMLQPPRPPA